MVKVKEIMAKSVFAVLKKAKIKETADLMKKNGIGSLLVKDDEQIVGIITETDIVHKVVAKGLNPQITNVEAAMSYPLLSIEAATDLEQAGLQMIENGIRHLAVTEGGKVVGLISMRDLLNPLLGRGNPTRP